MAADELHQAFEITITLDSTPHTSTVLVRSTSKDWRADGIRTPKVGLNSPILGFWSCDHERIHQPSGVHGFKDLLADGLQTTKVDLNKPILGF